MNTKKDKLESWLVQVNKKLDRIEVLCGTARNNGKPYLLDNQDLLFLLKISDRTLRRMRSRGDIPFMRIGGKIYYYERDVRHYIHRQYEKNKRNRKA